MKFFRLLLTNLFRNKLRTAFTISSLTASIFLVAVLISLLDGLTNPPETPDSALRLITRHKISLFNTLPVGYREKIAAVEGVDAVIGSMWFGGMYDNRGVDQRLAQFSVDTDQCFIVNPDSARAVLDILAALNQDFGKTIVMVTHDPKEAAFAGTRHDLEKGVLQTQQQAERTSAHGYSYLPNLR